MISTHEGDFRIPLFGVSFVSLPSIDGAEMVLPYSSSQSRSYADSRHQNRQHGCSARQDKQFLLDKMDTTKTYQIVDLKTLCRMCMSPAADMFSMFDDSIISLSDPISLLSRTSACVGFEVGLTPAMFAHNFFSAHHLDVICMNICLCPPV